MSVDSASDQEVISKESSSKSRSSKKKRPLVMKTQILEPPPTPAKSHPPATGIRSKAQAPMSHHVDKENNRWPFCIVWTPLPIVTWFIPIIGHTGVANSRGIIYDFSDDHDVTVDNFAFGDPTKYHQFQYQTISAAAWDQAIKETSDYYARTRHSICFNNCHQYISSILNKVKYLNKSDWTQTDVWWMITFKSVYTDRIGFARQWVPFFLVLIATIVALVILF